MIKKRDGRMMPFEAARIKKAIAGSFREDKGFISVDELSEETWALIETITNKVVRDAQLMFNEGDTLDVESIQDMVESQLMRDGLHAVARRYIIYRENHRKSRALRGAEPSTKDTLYVTLPEGGKRPLHDQDVTGRLRKACRGLEDTVDLSGLIDETMQNLYDGVKLSELNQALILAPRSHIERDPAYIAVSARVLLDIIHAEVFNHFPGNEQLSYTDDEIKRLHVRHFTDFIEKGIQFDRLDARLREFDHEKLSCSLDLSRDLQFSYLGLQTLYDRYFIHVEDKRIETPQYFWMRVAMGLAINEGKEKNERAIEFYNTLSTFRFVSATPTLFNSGTCHPQLSSCYLSTTQDDLDHIFKVISDNARLSKWSGGLGNDWTNVRATGSRIKGTNGLTQGVIPFLKVANDTAVAVNQGGKRKGALCSYLETWHLDIEDFVELRRNTGDERRRTHDMNTANWIPDLFMKRVLEEKEWTLFSPDEVKDLHDLVGLEFEKRYEAYEKMADDGKLRMFKRMPAMDLWRKMITMLFETGHPWITFKDPSNIRSPQSHCGVVHSSNLCTEILLNTSHDETAVCNLGSVNLPWHIDANGLNEEKLKETILTAMRMLDNVIDINYYPTPEAKNANTRHRPVGLGMMGFQDALYKLRLSYDSPEAVNFADRSMEMISYYAILSSSELAKERGTYSSYKGSKWDQGLLPLDTIKMLGKERGESYLDMDSSASMDWEPVRQAIKKHGMRNSNTMAIAPTATIANIANAVNNSLTQSIEPTYSHMFTKSNLSGEFIILNPYLVEDLKKIGMWDQDMIDDLKYFDGSISEIERVPTELKEIYKTAFEISPKSIIDCGSKRQKWIDMGQSLNLYAHAPNGRALSEMYIYAWKKGLKTTYYLRSRSATSIEKSSLDINKRSIQPRWMKNKSASSDVVVAREPATQAPKACSILEPDCDACQ